MRKGQFKPGNKAAAKENRKDTKEQIADIALSKIVDVSEGTAIDAALSMLQNRETLGLSVQQVIKLLELVAPYQLAKKKEELQEDQKIKIVITHTNFPDEQ